MYSGYTCYDAGPSSTIAFDFASDSLRVGGMRGGWEEPHSPLLIYRVQLEVRVVDGRRAGDEPDWRGVWRDAVAAMDPRACGGR